MHSCGFFVHFEATDHGFDKGSKLICSFLRFSLKIWPVNDYSDRGNDKLYLGKFSKLTLIGMSGNVGSGLLSWSAASLAALVTFSG